MQTIRDCNEKGTNRIRLATIGGKSFRSATVYVLAFPFSIYKRKPFNYRNKPSLLLLIPFGPCIVSIFHIFFSDIAAETLLQTLCLGRHRNDLELRLLSLCIVFEGRFAATHMCWHRCETEGTKRLLSCLIEFWMGRVDC